MELKEIRTDGIASLDYLDASDGWYWGSDFTYGDLYEAEELWQDHHTITKNRLIFVNAQDGFVHEPLKPKAGTYFGKPLYMNHRFYILLADFEGGKIRILETDENFLEISPVASIERSEIEDCYNLMLRKEPLMLTRSQSDIFEIIWPVHRTYKVGNTEAFCFAKDDLLYFSRWFEDPDYREEVVIRKAEGGSIAEVIEGSLRMNEDGQIWILK